MKRLLFIIWLFVSCNNNKPSSVEELENVRWKRLGKGIDYHHWSGNSSTPGDSIHFSIISPGKDVALERSYASLAVFMQKFKTLLNGYAPESKSGYIRLNLYEAMQPDTISVSIYLGGDIDSSQVSADMNWIKAYRHVTAVNFLSREMAKQIYLDDGNEGWDEILMENPLPNSIEVKVAASGYTRAWLDSFSTEIRDRQVGVSDVTGSEAFFSPVKKEYLYFEYKRSKD